MLNTLRKDTVDYVIMTHDFQAPRSKHKTRQPVWISATNGNAQGMR